TPGFRASTAFRLGRPDSSLRDGSTRTRLKVHTVCCRVRRIRQRLASNRSPENILSGWSAKAKSQKLIAWNHAMALGACRILVRAQSAYLLSRRRAAVVSKLRDVSPCGRCCDVRADLVFGCCEARIADRTSHSEAVHAAVAALRAGVRAR